MYPPYWHVIVGQASRALRAAIRQLDPEMAPPARETMEEIIAVLGESPRFQTATEVVGWLGAVQAVVFSGLVIVIAVSVRYCDLLAWPLIADDREYRAWRDPVLEDLVGYILW